MYANQVVHLNGTGYDPDGGNITLYEWDFDGDNTYDWSSTSSGSTTHIYNSAGIYNATLRVTDDENQTDTDIAVINVRTPPPLPLFSSIGYLILVTLLSFFLLSIYKKLN